MIGAFPPPTHGMAIVNSAVLDRLRSLDADPLVLDVSAPDLDNQFPTKLVRLTKILLAFIRLSIFRPVSGDRLYISVSGGLGQIYEVFFVAIARMKGMDIFMHHHSFAYLNLPKQYTQILIKTAGSSSVHITLSDRMAEQLRLMYSAKQTVSISNAVFCRHNEIPVNKTCSKIQTLGFISNISAPKGVFDFLNLMSFVESDNLPIQAKMAGPFHNSRIERAVCNRLAELRNVDYVGSKYGSKKDEFFKDIDALVFPTHYRNEAEPLVILEAMSYGVPIITYGRGCIPEIVNDICGLVVDTDEEFIPAAIEQIKMWLYNPTAFEAATQAAARNFIKIHARNNQRCLKLFRDLCNIHSANACLQFDS